MKTPKSLVSAIIMALISGSAFSQTCNATCSPDAGQDQTSVCPGNSISIGVANCANISCGVPATYSWAPSGGTNCTATVNPTTTTTYTLFVTYPPQCCCQQPVGSCALQTCAAANRQDVMTVTVNSTGCRIANPAGVQDEPSQQIIILPNPNSGHFSIEFTDPAFSILELKSIPVIVVYDSSGNLIFDKNIEGGKNEVDISAFSKGIYFVKVFDGEKTLVVKKVLYQ